MRQRRRPLDRNLPPKPVRYSLPLTCRLTFLAGPFICLAVNRESAGQTEKDSPQPPVTSLEDMLPSLQLPLNVWCSPPVV